MSHSAISPRAEVFGITETSVTIGVQAEPTAPIVFRLDGEIRAVVEDATAARMVRIEALNADAEHRLAVERCGVMSIVRFRTLPAPVARQVASFATLDDPHFGEPAFGVPGRRGRAVEIAGSDPPHWTFMNEDAVAEINPLGVDAVVVKGDVTHDGRTEQFAAAARTLARLRAPCHVVLGNHDGYGGVDGYAALEQPPAPRVVEIGGWCLVLLDTVERGLQRGALRDADLRWLEHVLEKTHACGEPTLLLMHHQPVLCGRASRPPDSIGLNPVSSRCLFALLRRHPQVRGVLAGHTHRNRTAWCGAGSKVPLVEVSSSKDYPGVFAHYRLYADGSFRQEVRRISSPRALAHSVRCEAILGPYRDLFFGSLAARSFAAPGFPQSTPRPQRSESELKELRAVISAGSALSARALQCTPPAGRMPRAEPAGLAEEEENQNEKSDLSGLSALCASNPVHTTRRQNISRRARRARRGRKQKSESEV